jgi:hypothetical protein
MNPATDFTLELRSADLSARACGGRFVAPRLGRCPISGGCGSVWRWPETMKASAVLFAFLLLATAICAGCASTNRGVAGSRVGTPLVQLGAFQPAFQDVARAVALSLKQSGEKPEEFYAEVSSEDKALVFHLWHASAFEPANRNVLGNLGGKCRDVWYDSASGKVTQTLFWQ